jgi:hypothetical protein
MKRVSMNMGAMAVALVLVVVSVQAQNKDRDKNGADRTASMGGVVVVWTCIRRACAQYVRPEPAVERFLVWFQNVLGQSKTGVKKRLVVFVGGVEILNKPQ